MKRILRLISSIVIVMGVGCKRESRSTRGPDTVAQEPKTSGEAKVSQAGRAMTGEAEWERALKAQQKQYEKVEELAKEVSKVCAGTNAEEAVDRLLTKLSDVLDAFESSTDQDYAITERTGLVSPFVRDVQCYWTRRRFEAGGGSAGKSSQRSPGFS